MHLLEGIGIEPRTARITDFLLALLAFRGLGGLVPLLFALGLSALSAWSLVQAARLFARGDVSVQRFRLKSGGAWRTIAKFDATAGPGCDRPSAWR